MKTKDLIKFKCSQIFLSKIVVYQFEHSTIKLQVINNHNNIEIWILDMNTSKWLNYYF